MKALFILLFNTFEIFFVCRVDGNVHITSSLPLPHHSLTSPLFSLTFHCTYNIQYTIINSHNNDITTLMLLLNQFLSSTPSSLPLSLHYHYAAPRSTTQHHAAPRSTTQHHAAPRSTTQHHAISRSITQHHAASRSITQHQNTKESN